MVAKLVLPIGLELFSVSDSMGPVNLVPANTGSSFFSNTLYLAHIYRERVTRGEQMTITLLSLLQTVPTTITSLALLSSALYFESLETVATARGEAGCKHCTYFTGENK